MFDMAKVVKYRLVDIQFAVVAKSFAQDIGCSEYTIVPFSRLATDITS